MEPMSLSPLESVGKIKKELLISSGALSLFSATFSGLFYFSPPRSRIKVRLPLKRPFRRIINLSLFLASFIHLSPSSAKK